MENIINKIKTNSWLVAGALIAGILLGWLLFHSSQEEAGMTQGMEQHDTHDYDNVQDTKWTCSMHPQILQDKPGKCPICGMDLIPVSSMDSKGGNISPDEIAMTESAARLADIQTVVISKGSPEKSIYLQGKVEADERNIAEMTARFGGRIEKLYINFTGQNVRKGQKLATIYSPELITAQSELLEAIKLKQSRPSLYSAAKGKLKLWDLTEEQISEIEQKGEALIYFDLLSPIAGTVTKRHVAIGDYVKEGTPLFKVVDLSRIWVMFDAYESDLPWISAGDKISFTIQALPGKNFSARVSYIDPFINEQTRVAKVRVEVRNPEMTLKPEMFATGTLESRIAETSNEIIVPKSAVLWTGKRAVVYVKVPNRDEPTFLYREVVLGPEAGEFYVIEEGLKEGEEIAVNGVFKIDAASQLSGKPSMMNPEGGMLKMGHDHGGVGKSGNNAAQVHESIKVAGECEICKDRIEKAANSIDGVSSAMWDIETKTLHLQYDKNKTSSDMVQKAIAEVGHDTEKYKAPDEVYNNLPACCKYERLNK